MTENEPLASTSQDESTTENDIVILNNTSKTIISLRSLYSQLFENEDEEKIKNFIKSGCGCHQGVNNKNCMACFSHLEIREYRIQCFEIDGMIEHENKLNDNIVAQLSALLHTSKRLMCCNRYEDQNELRSKTMMDYRFHRYKICLKSFLFLAFSKIWKMALPYIVIQRLRSDLCSLCQNNTINMSEIVNLEVEIKRECITEMLEHLKLVEKERSVYHDSIKLAKQNEISHISFDYAQQIFLPNLPDQPGPIYFLTLFKVGIFGIANELVCVQHNYVIPENMLTGKGANCILSMVHHYLAEHKYSIKATLYCHADNCVGQNKNKIVAQYLSWKVAVGLNQKITIMFLPVSHTKFSPDAGFGILKSKFQRSEVALVKEFAACIEASTLISKLNKSVIVGDENGTILVPIYDWQEHHSSNFKTIPNLKQWHYFTFQFDKPGVITCKINSDSAEVEFQVWQHQLISKITMPQMLQPKLLLPERQWYLYDSI
ncbi:uncharacterized protein LOC124807619 [Hydra vulgaris]|uniref:uncharacterized protein LOC124807619 n=1 Tax=Hydra vulgaris TaxID=6087 RepID=UPI001F5E7DEF|nr:uncharacterized protein LOC124807619 [Hydra vulgaris]